MELCGDFAVRCTRVRVWQEPPLKMVRKTVSGAARRAKAGEQLPSKAGEGQGNRQPRRREARDRDTTGTL
jgi:hypothetical protein